jgi:hypothetical protein
MTIITLPPDLENRLADEASRRGTTPELLALDGLRRLFAPQLDGAAPAETLFDFLGGHIGVVAGTAEPLSEGCGRRFSEGLADKQKGLWSARRPSTMAHARWTGSTSLRFGC